MKLFVVDAFAENPFEGNPAAICLAEAPLDAAWMQKVAAEMNLSETAFVRSLNNGVELRWFTPAYEVELCGHATLAAAHVLWTEGVVESDEPIAFHTKSGVLTCGEQEGLITMDFPATPPAEQDIPTELIEALNVRPTFFGMSLYDGIVVVESEEVVRTLKPDFRILGDIPMRGVMVTSRADDKRFDFVSRYFAPGAGVDEDPVTGSAHCCLGPYWGRQLGKTEMTAFQASARGGAVQIRLAGDRVFLGGRAVTMIRGEIRDAS